MLLKTELQVHSDEAVGAGLSLFWRAEWYVEKWLEDWMQFGITMGLTFFKFFPILVAVVLCGKEFKNKSVCFWRDDSSVVQIINSQSSLSKRVMRLICRFILHCLTLHI